MISSVGKLESVLASCHTTSQSQQITGTLQRGKYSQKKRHILPVAQQMQNDGKVEPGHAIHSHGGIGVQIHAYLTLASVRHEWSSFSRVGSFAVPCAGKTSSLSFIHIFPVHESRMLLTEFMLS
jgi:hypothetical protein